MIVWIYLIVAVVGEVIGTTALKSSEGFTRLGPSVVVVGGYAVANDVSARWWQKQGSGGQYCRGKSFDTFCPVSEFVDPGTVGDPGDLQLSTRVNGELVQSASTSTMVFSVPEMISDLSRGMTLSAGTILLTGTPAGVGAGRTPKLFLKHGDVVEVEIPGVGRISNPVVEED